MVVQGERLVSVAPDSATITMLARHRSGDAAEAKRVVDRALAVADAREKASGLAVAFGGALGPVYSINSLNSMQAHGCGNTTLDRIMVTGSRIDSGRYLQPQIDFTERVSAVFEISR